MLTVRIEPHYKITIPRDARDNLALKVGEEVQITLRRVKATKTYTPTASERRAIEKGREEIKKGNYYTLDEFRDWLLGSSHQKARAKNHPTRSPKRA